MSKNCLSHFMNHVFLKALLYFLLISSPPTFAIRPVLMEVSSPSPSPSPLSLPLPSPSPPVLDYVSFKPTEGGVGQRGVGSRPEVENCLPKGFKRTSAPSRYVNYQTLGSSLCSTPSSTSSKGVKKLP
ncbi:hypothetical protein TIFTF001_020181 [Ficus carica]|uniref:Uncharacterized protein n=1 Tax=Ficus carica TaxID=3494 RepID=A0AA88AEZ1_FICCA|nr:hypothetical protein TIFTF001_020181 [Ficus carica]